MSCPAEAERFVVLFNGDAPAAIEIVHAEQNHQNRASLETTRNRDDAFEIVRILVIGVQSDAPSPPPPRTSR
jgi:hypothetical protein